MEFTSLQLLILVFMYVFHLGPWTYVSSPQESLAEVTEQGRFGAAVSGDGVGRRRGESGGKWRGAKAAPNGGLGSSGEGRSWALHGEGRPVVHLLRRGGAPVTQGLGGRAWGLQEDMEKVVEWFI